MAGYAEREACAGGRVEEEEGEEGRKRAGEKVPMNKKNKR